MNVFLFFLHNLAIVLSLLGALSFRKEMLICLVCLMGVLSNLFVLKQITLFGYSVTCADVFAVGTSLGLNLIQEYWGKATAKRTIWLSFFCLIFFLCMTQFHLSYIPNEYDCTSGAFDTILCFAPRIVAASFVSYLISQSFECYFFGALTEWLSGRFFIFRNYCSLSLSQLIDTVMFSFLGLYGIAGNITHIIIVSYFIKLVIILFSSTAISCAKYFVPLEHKKNETSV